MPDHNDALALLPPAVQSFVRSHRIPADAVRAEGRVVLTVDQRWRVHVVAGPHHRVVLQSELLGTPEPPERRLGDLLLRLCKAAAGLLQEHASTLCIDPQRQALVLQQTLESGADQAALEDALADFTNALAFWSDLCRSETRHPERTAP